LVDVPNEDNPVRSRVIDLEIDIGADAVDYKYVLVVTPGAAFTDLSVAVLSAIAAQESLSGLETEMRKLEGIIQEIVDEMDYLKKREQRFSSTNGKHHFPILLIPYTFKNNAN
jgi:hypothetical protein